jgi:hypothetical protein
MDDELAALLRLGSDETTKSAAEGVESLLDPLWPDDVFQSVLEPLVSSRTGSPLLQLAPAAATDQTGLALTGLPHGRCCLALAALRHATF